MFNRTRLLRMALGVTLGWASIGSYRIPEGLSVYP